MIYLVKESIFVTVELFNRAYLHLFIYHIMWILKFNLIFKKYDTVVLRNKP